MNELLDILASRVTVCSSDLTSKELVVWSAEMTALYWTPSRLDMEKDKEVVSSVMESLLTTLDLTTLWADLTKKNTRREETLEEKK